jgi:ribosomal protein L28
MVKLLSSEENRRRDNMAVNITTRKDNVKNIRSHALNATKKRQNLNLQVYRLEDGTKVRLSTKEIRTLAKNDKAA